jgi:hypothetical protein
MSERLATLEEIGLTNAEVALALESELLAEDGVKVSHCCLGESFCNLSCLILHLTALLSLPVATPASLLAATFRE